MTVETEGVREGFEAWLAERYAKVLPTDPWESWKAAFNAGRQEAGSTITQELDLRIARALIVEMRGYMDRLGQQGIAERVDAWLHSSEAFTPATSPRPVRPSKAFIPPPADFGEND